MARFLSHEWFAEVAQASPPHPPGDAGAGSGDLVLEQVVHDAPGGEVRYRVVVTGRGAYIEPPPAAESALPAGPGGSAETGPEPRPAPDLSIACDWDTATQLAQGTLSSQAALMAGRLRVSGNLARLSGRAAELAGLDPVPDLVRRRTTY